MAYIGAENIRATSFDVWIYGMDASYNSNTRTCVTTLTRNGSTVATRTSSISNQVSEDYVTSFSGLSPETTYNIVCVVTYQTPDGNATASFSATATTTEQTVEPWDWSTINGPMYLATASQTQKAYAAITRNGPVSDFNYLVWNDLVYKTNEIIGDRGGSWNTTYGTLAETLMTSSDKIMTAERFNAVWWQCSQYINTGMGAASGGYCPVVSGSTAVKGSYFLDLANAVNNTIWGG